MTTPLKPPPVPKYFIHPLCEMVRENTQTIKAEIKEDIRKNGYDARFPIVYIVIAGKRCILDGRTRLWACDELGIEPIMEEWKAKGDDTPAAFVSRCLKHRNITDKERHRIIAKLLITPDEIKAAKEAGRVAIFENTPILTPPPKEGEVRDLDAHNVRAQNPNISARTIRREHDLPRRLSSALSLAAKHDLDIYGKLSTGDIKPAEAERQIKAKIPPPPMRMRTANPTADEAVAAAPRFDEITKRIHAIRRDLEALAQEPVGRELRQAKITFWLNEVASGVKFAKPFGPCVCNGDKSEPCKICDGFGWLTEAQLNLIPKR